MSLSSFTVRVSHEAVPVTPTGPGRFGLKTTGHLVIGGPSVTEESGYPLSHGEDYRFELGADDQVFGRVPAGEPDTLVYILVETGGTVMSTGGAA